MRIATFLIKFIFQNIDTLTAVQGENPLTAMCDQEPVISCPNKIIKEFSKMNKKKRKTKARENWIKIYKELGSVKNRLLNF